MGPANRGLNLSEPAQDCRASRGRFTKAASAGHFEGEFTAKGDGLHLKLEAADMPCPPCRFEESLRLTKVELEW